MRKKVEKTMETRKRMLLIMKMLFDGADETHGISINDVIKELGKHGPEPDRKSIYRDMAALREAGIDVNADMGGSNKTWKWMNRPFSVEELKMLVDALNVFPLITDEQRNALGAKVAALACKAEREKLARPTATRWTGIIDVGEAYENLNKVHAALRKGKSLRFADTVNGQKLPVSKVVSPAGVIFRDGYFWMVYNTDSVYPAAVRVDRMTGVSVLGIAADKNRAPVDYCLRPFGVDGNRVETVSIRAEGSGAVCECADKFWGTDAEFSFENGNAAKISARVCVTPEWWAWVAKMDGAVTVLAPEWVRKKAEEKTT